ncbi:S26 family signal peptidase [Candidatus Phytoplasma solani]|uniref:S26 family signal peptidase n=1 Tax=Candidatus Phytoplasma solani TaxID=69896 RepID=UPI00358EF8CC
MVIIQQNIKKQKPPRNLFRNCKKATFIILDVILLYLFIFSLGNLLFPKRCANFLGLAGFPVASNSMTPFIYGEDGKIGDFIFITGVWDPSHLKPVGGFDQKENPTSKPQSMEEKQKEKYDPNKGDIIVFENPHYPNPKQPNTPRFIIHRVVYNNTEKGRIGTWGDNNNSQLDCEKEIPYDKVVGKFIFKDRYIIPGIKKFITFIIDFIIENPIYSSLGITYLVIMFWLLRMIRKT